MIVDMWSVCISGNCLLIKSVIRRLVYVTATWLFGYVFQKTDFMSIDYVMI